MPIFNIPIKIQVGDKTWGEFIETNATVDAEHIGAVLIRNL